LQHAVELNPRITTRCTSWGSCSATSAGITEAQEVTRRAIKLNPALSRSHANLAIERRGQRTSDPG
jgi:hypothetical protein